MGLFKKKGSGEPTKFAKFLKGATKVLGTAAMIAAPIAGVALAPKAIQGIGKLLKKIKENKALKNMTAEQKQLVEQKLQAAVNMPPEVQQKAIDDVVDEMPDEVGADMALNGIFSSKKKELQLENAKLKASFFGKLDIMRQESPAMFWGLCVALPVIVLIGVIVLIVKSLSKNKRRF